MVDIKTNQQCNSDYSGGITDDMICANGNNNGGTTDARQGDSGGPLVRENGGLWFIEGATSWGYGCANPCYPGVWSRVAYNIDWVVQQTGVQPVLPNPTPPTPEPPTSAPWHLGGHRRWLRDGRPVRPKQESSFGLWLRDGRPVRPKQESSFGFWQQ